MSKFPLMSLESVEIDNYDLYKCPLTFDFSKKLNIIFGTNGTGKNRANVWLRRARELDEIISREYKAY